MNDVVRALGWKGVAGYGRLIGTVAFLSAALMVGGYLLTRLPGVPTWSAHAVLWLPWLVWLGHFFPRHHTASAATNAAGAYRAAFFLHIAPGISWNFAQMGRPGLVGALDGEPLRVIPGAVGLMLVAVGAVAIATALRSIGVARALFVGEYVSDFRRLAVGGVYGRLRHPLFAGGMLISSGVSVFFWTPQSLAMALVNLVIVPAYCVVEDRRCQLVHAGYADYRRRIPGLLLRPLGTR